MIEELLDYYSELFGDTTFSIGSALNVISHGMTATLLNSSFDRFRLTTKGDRLRNVSIKASGYFAAMSTDIDHLLDHPFGGFLHRQPVSAAYDIGLSALLSMPYDGKSGKRKKAFLSYLLLTLSHRLIDYFQLFGGPYVESPEKYQIMAINSTLISLAIIGLMVLDKKYPDLYSKIYSKIYSKAKDLIYPSKTEKEPAEGV